MAAMLCNVVVVGHVHLPLAILTMKERVVWF